MRRGRPKVIEISKPNTIGPEVVIELINVFIVYLKIYVILYKEVMHLIFFSDYQLHVLG